MIRIEVKAHGLERITAYEPLYIDWNEYQAVLKSGNNKARCVLVTNGKQSFQILHGRARKDYLAKHDYKDQEFASWEDVPG